MEANVNQQSNFVGQSEAVAPIKFVDTPVGDYTLRMIEKGEDLILQFNAESVAVPQEAGAMMAKALIDTYGPAIMDSTHIEMMDRNIIPGGSVYVRMHRLNTKLVKSKTKDVAANLSDSMQAF